MRIKTFGMLAASGILTAAFAYAVPAIADDTAGTATDSGAQSTQAAPNANSTDDQNIASQPDTNNTASPSANDNDATADTPSGDDDY